MAMYAGKVKDDGNWDDNTSLGALLEKNFSALFFRDPDLENEEKAEADKEYNKKIAFQAQAEAIIEHIVAKMEIKGIKTKGNVDTTVKGETKTAIPDDHSHEVDLPVKQENVVFTQNNDGTGHVQ